MEARPTLPPGKCLYHPSKKGISIEALSKIVDPVFRENYSGGIPDIYSGHPRGSELQEVLYDMTGALEHDIVETLVEQLIENDDYDPRDGDEAFYSEEYEYHQERYSLGEHGRLWRSFCNSLLHEQRFFNADARTLIAEIFENIHQQRDTTRQGPVYLIRPGDPHSSFWRARLAPTRDDQKAYKADVAKNLGPPPDRSRRAGRLNASGISAFYAAFDLDTCVAELRPAVGSTVASARFRITEPICVLDTTRFGSKPKEVDIFAAGARKRAAQWRFMNAFMAEIAQPISPGDEHLGYVPTQAVAEYLVHHHRFKFSDEERTINAIIYGSAQRPEGKNIALLGPAAVVGAEEATVAEERTAPSKNPFPAFDWLPDLTPENRPRIVPLVDSFEIHRVGGASFRTIQIPDPIDTYEPDEFSVDPADM